MRFNSKVCSIIVIGFGVACIVLGFTFGLYTDYLFANLYQHQLELTPSSVSHKLWSHTPVPLYMEVYLFNMTNAEEFQQNKSVIPNFKEVGPFVFSEVHDRVNVVWNDNNTVTYNQTRKWNFVPELSEDLSVQVTNLNVIGTTLSQMLKKFTKFKGVINWLFRTEHLTNTAPAKKWIFEGIDDKLLEYLSALEHMFNIPTPKTKFGWFYGRNMSSSFDGTFTVHTGTDNIYKVGMMDKWNGMRHTGFFKGQCGMVKGTSGELFPPMNPVKDELQLFITDMCSTLRLFNHNSSTVDGIKLYKYVGLSSSLDNGQFDPDNECNCIGPCIADGVRDASTCKKAPVYFSFPHFYLANKFYLDGISGMKPKESEHQFYIELDPVTGMPFDVRAQLQINVHLEPVAWLKPFTDVPKIYVPMMWFRQRAKITPELAAKAYMIHVLPEAIIGFSYGLLGFGFVIVIIRLCIVWRNSKESDDSELLIPPIMDEDENVRAK